MHISKLTDSNTPITVTQLVDMLHHLPALASLNVKLTKERPINPIQSPLTLQWPRLLRELYLNLVFNDHPDLIQSIHGQTMSNLQILHITHIPLTSHWSSYSHIPDLLQLKDLSLDTGLLDHIDIIREASWTKLPPLLTRLNLCFGRSLKSLLTMCLPNIVFLDLTCRELRRDDLMKLVGCVPNIGDISPSRFLLNDFSHLQLFTQLTSITIQRKLQCLSGLQADDDGLDHYEQILIDNLVRLTNLTSLRFDSWVPCRLSSWLALSTDLIHLRSLAVNLATLERYNFNPNLFTQFPHLEQLHFTDDFQQEEEFNSIKEFFSSPKQLPNLNRLEIGASREGSKYYFLYDRSTPYYDSTHKWDRSTGINVHDYRQPPKRAVIRPAPKKDLSRYGIEANPGPLIPNSFSALYHLSTNLTSRFRTTFMPISTFDIPLDLPPPPNSSSCQLLFMDGLHVIYSYLTSNEWSQTIRSCRQFYGAAVKEPSRKIMLYPLDDGARRLEIHPHYRFNRHIVGMAQDIHANYDLRRFPFDQFIEVLTTLPYLQTLACVILTPSRNILEHDLPLTTRMKRLWSYVPFTNSSSLDSLLPSWPQHLHTILLNLNNQPFPTLIQTIPAITSLTSCTLYYPTESAGMDFLRLIRSHTQLTDLALFTYADDCDLLARGQIDDLPIRLTSLNINNLLSANITRMRLPQLQKMVVHTYEPGMLQAVRPLVPNLWIIPKCELDLVDVPFLPLFPSLTTLVLYRISHPRFLLGDIGAETQLVDALIRCRSLTSLEVSKYLLRQSNSWRRLAAESPSINRIALLPGFEPLDDGYLLPLIPFAPRLYHLSISPFWHSDSRAQYEQFLHCLTSHFLQLRTFTLHLKSYRDPSRLNFTQEYFSSPNRLLPVLTHLSLSQTLSPAKTERFEWTKGADHHSTKDTTAATYRQPNQPIQTTEVTNTVSRTAPMKDLTRYGVEANPGPLFANPFSALYHLTTYLTSRFRTTHVPMTTLEIPLDLSPPIDASLGQLLFSDGLHLIYSYLSEVDWSHAITCCRQWYSSAVKEPQRQMRCPFDWTTGRLMIQPDYRFNRHLVGLEWSDVYPRFSFEQLIQTLTTLPYLTTLFCYIPVPSRLNRVWSYLPLSDSDDAIPTWPQHLHTILINFNDESYPTLTETIPTIASLTSCTLHYPTEEDGADFLRLIRSHHQLTNLTILTYARSDLLALGQIYDLPIQLISLNINERISPNLTRMRLPQLQKIVVGRYEPGMLQEIHPAVPNLLIIPECVFHLGDAQFLSLFTSLTTLIFYREPIHPPGTDMETILVDGLIRCPSLTTLAFVHHVLIQPQSWRRLAEESNTINRIIFNQGAVDLNESYLLPLVPFAPRLHHLSITCYNYGSIREFEQFLHDLTTHFQHLRSFKFHQCRQSGFNHLICVKDYLASPDRLPQLSDLSIIDAAVVSDNPSPFQWTKWTDQRCMKDATATYRAPI